MTPRTTAGLGERFYLAYWHARWDTFRSAVPLQWEQLAAREKGCWEMAGRAIEAQATPSEGLRGALDLPALERQFWAAENGWARAGSGQTSAQQTGASMVWAWLRASLAAPAPAEAAGSGADDLFGDLTLTELLGEAARMGGPWRRATGIAADEEEHNVYLRNDANDSVIVNADGVALLVNAALAPATPPLTVEEDDDDEPQPDPQPYDHGDGAL